MATVIDKSGSNNIIDPHIESGENVRVTKNYYTLLKNATATGNPVGPINGGDYLWRAEASNWNGATATLEFLGLDGLTWYPVLKSDGVTSVTLTATGSVAIGIAQNAVLRVRVSGAVPVGLSSSVGGI